MISKNTTRNVTRDNSFNNVLDDSSDNNISNISSIKDSASKEGEIKNELIPVLINKPIKEAFKITLEERGIDIMNPERFIDAVYANLSKENKDIQFNFCKFRIQMFVKSFIFFLVNWKFSVIEEVFGINEKYIKALFKKQLFKCLYLQHHTVEEYKKKKDLIEQNYEFIYHTIKTNEYKYINNDIVGIKDFEKKNKGCVYTLKMKFRWFITFIDYLIVSYLSNDLIIPFYQFLNNLKMEEEVKKFDMENSFDLSHFFSQSPEIYSENINYTVEIMIFQIFKCR